MQFTFQRNTRKIILDEGWWKDLRGDWQHEKRLSLKGKLI